MDSVKISQLEDVEVGDDIMITQTGRFGFTEGKTYEVSMDNGKKGITSDDGRFTHLHFIGLTEGYVVQNNVFKVGDAVQISAIGRDEYVDLPNNPYGTVGTVIEVYGVSHRSRYRYRVDWSDGTNYYRPEDLELVSSRAADDTDTEGDTDLLTTRGSTHGEFSESSVFVQDVKDALRGTPNWDLLAADQKEALEMMAGKMGRALFGQHNFKDHWDDLSGYAQLVANRLT